MKTAGDVFTLPVTNTDRKCAVGERVGDQNFREKKTPVICCEGACIRGEIARLAANMVAMEEPYRRACHGELFTIRDSSMARWVQQAERIVLIDGCFLRCHGRLMENLVGKENLVQFDALTLYRKFTDRFDIDSVPEEERKQTARLVADKILLSLKDGKQSEKSSQRAELEVSGAT